MTKPTQSTSLTNALVPVTFSTGAQPNSPTSALPDEIMIMILGYLNAQDLSTCDLVCKQWKSYAQDPFLWKGLLKTMFPSCNHLEIVDFKKVYFEQDRARSNIPKGVYASRTLTGHTESVTSLVIVDGK